MQEKVSSREAERLGLMPYRANIQQEIRFILSTPLLFFLILPDAPQKATPSSPRGPIGFLADSEEKQHNCQNAGEGAITFSRNVCGLKRTRYKAFHEPLFRCGRRTFCAYSVNFQKTVEKLIRICHTKIMHLEGKEFCTVCAAK